jgi:sugar (pentulose or hexulose) kinase
MSAASSTKGYAPNRYLSAADGAAEQDPKNWWKGCCQAVRVALRVAPIEVDRIGGIGECGFHHCPLFPGSDGRPVRPSILTHD